MDHELETDMRGFDLDDGFCSTTSSGVVQTPKQGDFYQLTFPLSDDEDYLDDGIQDIHHDGGASETSSTNTSMIQTKVLCDNMVRSFSDFSSTFLPSFSVTSLPWNTFKRRLYYFPIPFVGLSLAFAFGLHLDQDGISMGNNNFTTI